MSEGRKKNLPRPDTGWSWVVAAATSLVYFSSSGLIRSSGVVYIALIKAYGISREEAAWPLSLSDVVMCLTGPVAGVLSHMFTIRSILLVGSCISCLGIALCFFGSSIQYLAICLGIVHGVGVGFNITLVPVIINQYFQRHRSTASGISFAGSSFGSFIFPYLMEYLFHKYGLRGGFLLLGGIIMHGVVGSALLRPPEWLNERPAKNRKPEKAPNVNPEMLSTSSLPVQVKEQSPFHDEISVKKDEETAVVKLFIPESNEYGIRSDTGDRDCNKISDGTLVSKEMTISLQKLHRLEDQKPFGSKTDSLSCPKQTPNLRFRDHLSRFISPSLKIIAPVFNRPICYILYLTHLAFFTAYYTYLMIIIDFAVDCGVAQRDAIFIISAFSAADLLGRLSSGWITDRGFVSRKNLTIVSLILEGTTVASIPLITSFPGMIAIALCLGLIIGTTLSPIHIIIAEYLGLENMGLAIGVSYFIYGVFTFSKPFLIGYFRDNHGSYNYLFHLLGLAAIFSAFVLLVESLLSKPKSKEELNRNLGQAEEDAC